jgi:hypothetical protein
MSVSVAGGVRNDRDLVRQVDSDDVGALLRQADGVAPALPAGGTSDESDFSLDATCHIVSPLMSGCQFFTQD